MSHDTYLKTVPIWDINALHSAVADLQAKGVACELKTDSKARMWDTRKLAAPYVLHLHKSKYDIAFKQNKDGSYTPVCDLMYDSVREQIGWPDFKPNPGLSCWEQAAEIEASAIGQLTQLYSNHALRNAVTNEGFTIIEESVDANGDLQLYYN